MAAALVTAVRQSPVGSFTTASNLAGRVDLISASPLFAGMSQDAYEEIARRARPRTFARDELLYMQGQPVQSLALLRSGSVKITQLAPNGNEVILWMYGAGCAVGAISDPASRNHTSTARAMQQSTALVWDYAAFQSIMKENPQIGKNNSLVLASRLNELEERFREVATEKVARRIALALLRLLKHIGKTVHGGVEISLSREELAQMTGTTLFTASRVLSKWGEMGFVLPRRESVLVCDRNRLELVSDDI
jgi:CRP/FNR family transcriptional regulator, nitrogen oxide reductase regulator